MGDLVRELERYAVAQHEASAFLGPDGEINRRASWRGVMRKVRRALLPDEEKPGSGEARDA